MLALNPGAWTQSPSTLRKGLTPTGNSSSVRDYARILALQSGICPALGIAQAHQPHKESAWNATWAVLHQLLNNPDSLYWISETARTSLAPEYAHSPSEQTRDKPTQIDCSRWCCSFARTEDDVKQLLWPSASRSSEFREKVLARPWLHVYAVPPAPVVLQSRQNLNMPCSGNSRCHFGDRRSHCRPKTSNRRTVYLEYTLAYLEDLGATSLKHISNSEVFWRMLLWVRKLSIFLQNTM